MPAVPPDTVTVDADLTGTILPGTAGIARRRTAAPAHHHRRAAALLLNLRLRPVSLQKQYHCDQPKPHRSTQIYEGTKTLSEARLRLQPRRDNAITIT